MKRNFKKHMLPEVKKQRFPAYLQCLFFLCPLLAFAAGKSIRTLDAELTAAFKNMAEAEYRLRYDSLAPAFLRKLGEVLQDPATFHASWDSLSKYVGVRTSEDGKLRFYCWNDLTGGTWHNINCVAQFEGESGDMRVHEFLAGDSGETDGFADCIIYGLHTVKIEDEVCYLVFGTGTHGGGHSFNIVRTFKIRGDSLVLCGSVFPEGGSIIIQYPRMEKSGLAFDPRTNEISYNEFTMDEESGFYMPTGRRIYLKLSGSAFRER